MKVIKKWSSY